MPKSFGESQLAALGNAREVHQFISADGVSRQPVARCLCERITYLETFHLGSKRCQKICWHLDHIMTSRICLVLGHSRAGGGWWELGRSWLYLHLGLETAHERISIHNFNMPLLLPGFKPYLRKRRLLTQCVCDKTLLVTQLLARR